MKPGQRVRVIDPETGRPLFTARIAQVQPALHGHVNVVPERQTVTLTPRFRIEPVDDPEPPQDPDDAADRERWRRHEGPGLLRPQE